MGTADVIPGVSGGTMALITGIYQRLVHAISQINANFIVAALKGDFAKSKEELLKWDFNLFIPLLAGIGLAVLTMSKVMTVMLTEYTALTFAFFFGLILASAGFVFKHVDELNFKNVIFLVIGLVFAVRNLSDGRGAAGLADLSPLRRAVYSTLSGHRPAECLDPFHFRKGRLLHISDGVIWWQDEYQTSFTFPMLSRN